MITTLTESCLCARHVPGTPASVCVPPGLKGPGTTQSRTGAAPNGSGTVETQITRWLEEPRDDFDDSTGQGALAGGRGW